MQRLGRWKLSSAGFFLILLSCLGCAAGPAVPVPPQKAAQCAQPGQESKPAPPFGIRQRAERVLNVTVEDGDKEIIVRLQGNAPFQDYQFRREGENGFALELADIHSTVDVPASLPVSDQVVLSFTGETSPGRGIELLGTLTRPLEHYLIDTAGNDLILTIYPAGQIRRMPSAKPAPSPKHPAPMRAKAAAKPAPQPPPALAPQPPPSAAQAAGIINKKYTGKPISLDLMDADLRNVLRLLADITGTNIVIEPDVSGKVTLKVDRVPWDQVLDMILSMNGLGKEQVGNVLRIARQEKLKSEYAQRIDEIKSKQALVEAAKDAGEITTTYLTINYAQPAEIAAKINEVKSDKGKISVDERTSLIIYSDYPARIENARQLIARLDKPASQVLIEARIAQLSTAATRDLGIRWDLSSRNTNPTTDFIVNHAVTGDLFHFTYGQLIGKALWNIDMTLSALETASQGKVISAPRVLTLNNVKAVISQGTQIPYLQASQAVPGGTAGQGAGTIASVTFQQAVLELQVTPHITPDRKIRLEIQAKEDRPNGQTVNGQPELDTRSVTTELLVEDGNTIVIGGVIQEDDNQNSDATPGMSNIPLIGNFFKKNSISRSKTEMLIFISPKIVDAAAVHGE